MEKLVENEVAAKRLRRGFTGSKAECLKAVSTVPGLVRPRFLL